MKPIGLVTCYFHHNYGSMLQAYATEMIMQQMELPFQTIACKAPINYMQENKILYIIKKLLIADWKMRLGKMKIERAKKENPMFAKNWEIRNKAFDQFAETFFHVSPYCKNHRNLSTCQLIDQITGTLLSQSYMVKAVHKSLILFNLEPWHFLHTDAC